MKIMYDIGKEDFLKKSQDKKIICFGMGQMFYDAIDHLFDKSESILLFEMIDNSKLKQGKEIVVMDKCYSIKSPEVLETMDVANCIMLITSKFYREIVEQCNQISNLKEMECFLYVDLYWNEPLTDRALYGLEALNIKKGMSIESAKEHTRIRKMEITENPDYFIVPKLNFVVTEKCSLSCKDCRALVPYVKNPKEAPLEEVIEEIDIVLEAVDEVVDMEPIGGEPFLYPYLAEVLEHMAKSPKVNNVVVSTNGTIIPKEKLTNVLKNRKIFVEISDYGHIDKMAALVKFFEQNQIAFEVETDQTWFDVGGLDNRGRTHEELKEEYRNCYCQYLVKYIWEKKIWVCPRAPRLSSLNIIEELNDYESLEATNAEETRKRIIRCYNATYAEACNYCNQGDLNTTFVKAGIQTDGRIVNSDYTIIKRSEYEKLLKK